MTAVEWLEKELYEKFEIKGDYILYSEILYKAKQMEKQKLIEMHDKGFDSVKQLNDEYAIEFAEWVEKLRDSDIDSLGYAFWLDNTTKQLLEIFKKEKGL
jgi:hypothetical protein